MLTRPEGKQGRLSERFDSVLPGKVSLFTEMDGPYVTPEGAVPVVFSKLISINFFRVLLGP